MANTLQGLIGDDHFPVISVDAETGLVLRHYKGSPQDANVAGKQFANLLCLGVHFVDGWTREEWSAGIWDAGLYPLLEQSPFKSRWS